MRFEEIYRPDRDEKVYCVYADALDVANIEDYVSPAERRVITDAGASKKMSDKLYALYLIAKAGEALDAARHFPMPEIDYYRDESGRLDVKHMLADFALDPRVTGFTDGA